MTTNDGPTGDDQPAVPATKAQVKVLLARILGNMPEAKLHQITRLQRISTRTGILTETSAQLLAVWDFANTRVLVTDVVLKMAITGGLRREVLARLKDANFVGAAGYRQRLQYLMPLPQDRSEQVGDT